VEVMKFLSSIGVINFLCGESKSIRDYSLSLCFISSGMLHQSTFFLSSKSELFNTKSYAFSGFIVGPILYTFDYLHMPNPSDHSTAWIFAMVSVFCSVLFNLAVSEAFTISIFFLK
jgi:hypothetical protein